MTDDDVSALMHTVEEYHRLHTLALDENAPVEDRVAAAKAILDKAGHAPRTADVRTLDEIEAELARVRAELACRERSALH